MNNVIKAHPRTERENIAKPTLKESNDTAKIVIKHLKSAGATTRKILGFLEKLYKPHGITFAEGGEFDNIPQTYSATQIAWLCGIFSLYGNPHAQAVSCIINENLLIGNGHIFTVSECNAEGCAHSFRYDEYVLEDVKQWLNSYDYPHEIYGVSRTYHVIYRK